MDCEIKISINAEKEVSVLTELGVDVDAIAVEHMVEQLQEEALNHTCDEHDCSPVFLSSSSVSNGSFSLCFDVCCEKLGEEFEKSVYDDQDNESDVDAPVESESDSDHE